MCFNNTWGVIMIRINLSAVLGKKRITQAELARKTGIRPATINQIYNEFCERINIEHLDRICEYLECNIDDLLEYVPNKEKKTGKYLIVETKKTLLNERGLFSTIIFIKKHYFSTVLDCFKVMLFLIFLETFLQLYAKFKILYFFILCENFFDFVRKATPG